MNIYIYARLWNVYIYIYIYIYINIYNLSINVHTDTHSLSLSLSPLSNTHTYTHIHTHTHTHTHTHIYIYIYKEELDTVLRRIKNRKAAGLDEIPPEVWKTRQFDDILLRQCNAVYSQNRIERWTKGCILPFPKKGDLGLAKNYRGITLTSVAAKIYNALLRTA